MNKVYTKDEVARICVQLRDLLRANPDARVVPVEDERTGKIILHKVENLF